LNIFYSEGFFGATSYILLLKNLFANHRIFTSRAVANIRVYITAKCLLIQERAPFIPWLKQEVFPTRIDKD